MSSIGAFWNDNYKNHYVEFIAQKTGSNTVVDQFGTPLALMDVTAYAAATLPGNVGDMLLITGIPTMESYGLRFRCNNATVTTAAFPPTSGPTSHVNPVLPGTTSSSLTLSATASVGAMTSTLWPVADTYVASGHAGTNYGSSTSMYVESAGLYGSERAWLQFNLSSIPAGSTISNAILKLWNYSVPSSGSLAADVLGGTSDNWTANGITWDNQPSYGNVLDTQTLGNTKNVWVSWNVTPLVQSKLAGGNNLVSFVVKADQEGTSNTYYWAFDTERYSNGAYTPQLVITASGGSVAVAQVQFFYRYSADNATWGPWTAFAIATNTPYSVAFNYPQGYGYYEFYSQATDSNNNVEPTPAAAQAFTHYSAIPAYYPVISLDGLYQKYDGQPKSVTVTTIPSGTAYSVTYNGSPTLPVNPGTYAVTATATLGGDTATTTDVFTIGLGTATVNISNLNQTYDGTGKSVTVSTVPAGLSVSVTYNGSPTPPITAGTYTAVASITNSNYAASTATGTLTIAEAGASIFFGTLSFTYDGSPKIVSVTTNPAGLSVVVTYNGSQTPPSAVGSYMVVATVTDPNYGGTAYGSMTIAAGAPVAVPALGLWGLLVAAGALGILGMRKRR
jgi:hypothetical protein